MQHSVNHVHLEPKYNVNHQEDKRNGDMDVKPPLAASALSRPRARRPRGG
jgi:hypothetical protein